MWGFINAIISGKKNTVTCPSEIYFNDSIIEDPNEISEKFNNYFVKVGQSIAANISNANDTSFKRFLTNSVSQSITLVPLNPNELYNAINSLNSNKSCGHDEISPHFLRLGCEMLAPILSLLFSYVFDLGFFPQIFKTAKVIPIFKNGDK